MPLLDAAHIGLTRLRRLRAAHGVRGGDAARMAPFRAVGPQDVIHIVGTGASVNDLGRSDWDAISRGRSISINMGVLAPVDFDICSFEFMPNAFLADTVACRLRGRTRPFVLWVQDRAQHRGPYLDAMEAEFPMHRYAPVDVSAGGCAATLRAVWRAEMRARVLGPGADFRWCYALIGSVARAILLALALGYRRICLIGIDQNANPYFWQEGRMPLGAAPWQDESGVHAASPRSGLVQASGLSLASFLDILRADGVAFSVIDPARRSALSERLPPHAGAG